ncbi:MAG: CPBP family glutamic-type intramembrane protease [Candidatus Heimdallarchaeota archaeon]
MKEEQRKNYTWLYFLLVAIYSLAFYLPAIVISGDSYKFPKMLLILAGGAGPIVIGSILVRITYSKEERKDFLHRVFKLGKSGFFWFFVILFANLIPTFVSIIAGLITKSQGTTFFSATEFFTDDLVILFVGITILGVFAEELGWRGYALEGLQKKMHPFFSSLLLGLYWTIWHFPLFFIEGTYQAKLGFGSIDFYTICFGIFFQAFIMTWIYNNTNKSIFSAVLFHIFTNVLGKMFNFNSQIEIIRMSIYGVFAGVIIINWTIRFIKNKVEIKEIITTKKELPDTK